MTALLTHRDSRIEQLTGALGKDVRFYAAAGRFDLTQIKQKSFRAPAIFISILTAKPHSVGFSVNMAAFIVSLPMASMRDKDSQAVVLVEETLNALARYGVTDASAQNLYTGKFEQSQVALWAVEWTDIIEANTSKHYALLDSFTHFHSRLGESKDDLPLAGAKS